MKLQQFDGGLSTRLRPQFISITEGDIYENVDSERGSLLPVRAKELQPDIDAEQYNTFYESNQEWVSADIPTSWLEYNNVLYAADGVQPTKYDGTNEYRLGIETPDTAPVVAAVTVAQSVSDFDTSVSSSGGIKRKVESYILVNSDSTFYADPLAFDLNVDGEVENARVLTVPSTGLYAASRSSTTTATRNITISNVIGADYGTEGVRVYRAYGGSYYLIGILADETDSLVDNTEDISGNEELDSSLFAKLSGTYQYTLTFLNSDDGTESGPSEYSEEITVKGPVDLSNLAVSTDPQVDKKKLYRIGGTGTVMTLVETLDNATTTYSDSTIDSELQADVLESVIAAPAPAGLKYLREAYAMLWAAEGNKLRYTPIAQPNSWPELYFITYADEITGIAPVANGIIVLTKYKSYLVTGTGPSSLASQLLRSDQGCLANESIQLFQGSALWASTDGICASNGSNVELISKSKLGKISLNPIDSALYDEVYYLVEEDSILAVDMRYTTIFKRLSLGVKSLTIANDELYGWNEGEYKMFASSTFETFVFRSARLTESIVSEEKSFKKFHLYSKGDIIIKIIAEDGSVLIEKQFNTDGRHELQVSSLHQRQEFIQIELSGTGEVYEVRYGVGHG